MKKVINTFEKFADDAAIEIIRSDADSLVLCVEFPSRGNEKWIMRIESIVHMDMGTAFILGSTRFGDLTLLPDGYTESRNFDHGSTQDKYKVIKFTDSDLKQHFIVYLGDLTFHRIKKAEPSMRFATFFGKRALGIALPKDYIDWAESLLYEGIESTNITILAGFGLEKNPDSHEVEIYFQKALADLDLSIPSDKQSLKLYAKSLCQSISSGSLAPESTLSILTQFYLESNYDDIYSIWDGLYDDLEMIKSGKSSFFNTGLTSQNKKNYIQDVASQFIVLLDDDLPEDFFELKVCHQCGHIGKSDYKTLERPWIPDKIFRYIHKRGQAKQVRCSKCKALRPSTMRDYKARKRYFESKK